MESVESSAAAALFLTLAPTTSNLLWYTVRTFSTFQLILPCEAAWDISI
jgi:hypothetical protein